MSVDPISILSKYLSWIPAELARPIEGTLKKLPLARRKLAEQQASLTRELESVVRPYSERFPPNRALPEQAMSRDDVLAQVSELSRREQARWEDGFVSGGIYHGASEHVEFLNRIYGLQSQTNPLHFDLFPSTVKFETEVIEMVARMLGKGTAVHNGEVCGSVSRWRCQSARLSGSETPSA